jgi:NitT/TauT family transport system ATP-binding protein
VNVLSVKNVSKTFSKAGKSLDVLSDITFSVEPGRVVAILGKSGSGKTTLLNIIAKLEAPSSGFVDFEGGVSYTPQKDLLLPWRNVMGNILLPFEIKNSLTDADRNKIDALLQELDVSDFKQAYPQELSGGMRQKVSLIRALAEDKPLYIFDESFSAVDFDSRLKLIRKIRNYLVQNKKIGLFVTHNIEEAISIADRIIVFSPRPARVIHEAEIKIPDEMRDPVSIRRNPEFQNQFDSLWKIMAQA